MFKVTIERIDPDIRISSRQVYMTKEQAVVAASCGVQIKDVDERYLRMDNLNKKIAIIPIPDYSRTVESKIYEQIVEDLDIKAVIGIVNGGVAEL